MLCDIYHCPGVVAGIMCCAIFTYVVVAAVMCFVLFTNALILLLQESCVV